MAKLLSAGGAAAVATKKAGAFRACWQLGNASFLLLAGLRA